MYLVEDLEGSEDVEGFPTWKDDLSWLVSFLMHRCDLNLHSQWKWVGFGLRVGSLWHLMRLEMRLRDAAELPEQEEELRASSLSFRM
jgi:hypothetical protein